MRGIITVMKPELPSSIPRPELFSGNNNLSPEFRSPFETLENKGERAVQSPDRAPAPVEIRNDAFLATTPAVVVSSSDVKKATNQSNPVTAGDEDLIEREWVDKAKVMINETKGDPYKQEEAIVDLRNDYKNKRYEGKRNVA